MGTGLLAFLDQGVRLLGGALNGPLRQKRVEGRYTNNWRSSGVALRASQTETLHPGMYNQSSNRDSYS